MSEFEWKGILDAEAAGALALAESLGLKPEQLWNNYQRRLHGGVIIHWKHLSNLEQGAFIATVLEGRG